MSTFAYVARDRGGRVQRGLEQAESPNAAVAMLRGRGWAVIDVQAAAEVPKSVGEMLAAAHPGRWLPPRSIDVELSLNQLAVMLHGGLTLLAAMRTTSEQCRRLSMRRVWEDVGRRVQAGSSFADAMAAHRCFSRLIVQLVRVGEQTGTLEAVLRRGADVLERRRGLRTSLLTALAYPTLVLIAAFGVTGFMVFNVIPKIEVFLSSLGRKLPPMTQSLIDISHYLRQHAVHIVAGAAGLVGLSITLYSWPPGRLFIDRTLLRVPVLGHLLRLAATALFSRALGMLVRSGVTLLEALRTVEGLHRNHFLRQSIAAARDIVIQGGSLAEGLGANRAFLPMLPAMVTVGESTGTLDDVLDETARFHEEHLQAAIRRFSIIIEPVIIVVVGGIVGFVYIAFFMALFAAAGPGG